MTRAPLRFLLAILLLWTGARAAILWSGRALEISPVPAAIAAARPPAGTAPAVTLAAAAPAASPGLVAGWDFRPARVSLAAGLPAHPARAAPPKRPAASPLRADGPPGAWPSFPPLPPFRLRPVPTPSRWQISAWLLLRDEGGAALAPGGTLGGSQAGARIRYDLGNGLALSARAYLPLRRTSGAEVAAGLDWRPVPSLPVNLLAERRQRLGRDGRNAFAITAYGGTSRDLTSRVRVDLYGQAGMVGLKRRDLFADGAARLSRRIGPVEVGAGAWGAAQPGVARLHAGPSLSWRLPVRDAHLRLQADWRFRLAGDAMPRSGPALTLAMDF